MCTQLQRLSFLGRGCGKGGDFRSKCARELDGHVAKSPDADDAHAGGGIHAMCADRGIDRDAAAKQGSGVLALQFFRDRNGEARIHADGVRISAIAVHAGSLALGAEVLFALKAPFADAAAVRLPADTHALTHRQRLYVTADCGNGTHNLVTGDKRKLADSPVIVNKVNIAVADAAVGDLNLNFCAPSTRPESTYKAVIQLPPRARQSIYRTHDSFPSPSLRHIRLAVPEICYSPCRIDVTG